MSHSYASHAMSTLWTYRSLYTVCHEFWLTHACSVCAFRVLDALETDLVGIETFIKATRILHEMSERFPLSRHVLASLQLVLKKRQIKAPPTATKHLKYDTREPELSIMHHTVVSASLQVKSADPGLVADVFRILTISDIVDPTDLEDICPD